MISAVVELAETLGKLIDAPLPRLNTPVPLAVSVPFAVFGLIAIPAFAPVAVMLTLTLTLFEAIRESRVLALHDTASLTLMLPLPAKVEPWLERIVTLLSPSAVESVAPEMSPEGIPAVDMVPVNPDPIVKSAGSINQVPLFLFPAIVVICAVSAIFTLKADVSIEPPSPC